MVKTLTSLVAIYDSYENHSRNRPAPETYCCFELLSAIDCNSTAQLNLHTHKKRYKRRYGWTNFEEDINNDLNRGF